MQEVWRIRPRLIPPAIRTPLQPPATIRWGLIPLCAANQCPYIGIRRNQFIVIQKLFAEFIG